MEEKELIKYVESFCEDCMIWIYVKNCRTCLFNLLRWKVLDDKNREWTDVENAEKLSPRENYGV